MSAEWERLADQIRAEMSARGWSQHELAERAGVSERTINRLLNGPRSRLPNVMPQIEHALGWEPGTARRVLYSDTPAVVRHGSELVRFEGLRAEILNDPDWEILPPARQRAILSRLAALEAQIRADLDRAIAEIQEEVDEALHRE